MAEHEDHSQKTEEPTQKRLADARRKGRVPVSRELNSWLVLAAAAVLLLALGPAVARDVTGALAVFVLEPHAIPTDFEHLRSALTERLAATAAALGLVAAALLAAAAGGGILQHGPLLSAESLKPDLSRLSPLQGFRRLFSARSLVEFAKGLVKMAVVGAVAWAVLAPELGGLPLLVSKEPAALLDDLYDLSLELLGAVVAALAAIAGLDFLYQRFEHLRGQRMTRSEVREEHKQLEGDPLVKARLRAIRLERARRRMMAAVPKADVVITNPSHFAVALAYREQEMEAPVVVAKGADHLALKIRELAHAHKVPVVENPPLSRALYYAVEIDQPIPVEHYKAVAEIIGYVWRLEGRLRPRPQAAPRPQRSPNRAP